MTCENQHENETIYTYILNVHFYSMPNFGLGVDIFWQWSSKLPRKKAPRFDFAHEISTPLFSPLKYEILERKSQITYKFIFYKKNLGCYSKIGSDKSLGIWMLYKSVQKQTLK